MLQQVEVSAEWDRKLKFHVETGKIDFLSDPVIRISPEIDLWIIRHAETYANQKKILQGSDQENENTMLSPKGESQAKELSDQMVYAIRRLETSCSELLVLSSPAQRASQTAQFFLKKIRNVSPISCAYFEHAFLHEIRFGEISGLTEEEVFKLGDEYVRFADLFRKEGNALVRLNGGESFYDLLSRVKNGFLNWHDNLLKEHAKKRRIVVIFTHMITASALRVLLRDQKLLDQDLQIGQYVNWRKIIPNAECLVWDQKQRQTQRLSELKE